MSSPDALAPKASVNKKKGTTLPLNTFLKPEGSNWADDDPESEAVPTLPRAPGGHGSTPSQGDRRAVPEPDLSRLPSRPPFKIFVGNLDYNVTPQELGEYFHAKYKVVDVHLLMHKDTGNVRGAFVEFETAEDLRGALTENGKPLKERALRVDVASDRPGRGFPRQGGYDDRNRRHFDDDRRGYGDRNDFGSGFGVPHRGNQIDRLEHERSGSMERGQQTERGFNDRNFHDPRDGSFDGERRARDRGGFSGAPREDMDAPKWGHKHVPQPQIQPPAPVSPQTPSAPAIPPAERKKLVLAPRSKSTNEAAEEEPSASTEKPKKSNPFGNAKPVDATARLRELEEKIAKQKAEAALAKEKEKAERSQAAANAPNTAPNSTEQKLTQAPPGMGRGPTSTAETIPGPPPNLPSASGRGYGHFQEPVNGQMRAPPGMDGRGEMPGGAYGRGRRGRGREGPSGGRFMGEARGRAPGRGFPPHAMHQPPPQHLLQNRPPPDAARPRQNESGFQEAGDRRAKGRTRGWETHTPSTAAPQHRSPQQGASAQNEPTPAEVSKVTNMFDMLGTADD